MPNRIPAFLVLVLLLALPVLVALAKPSHAVTLQATVEPTPEITPEATEPVAVVDAGTVGDPARGELIFREGLNGAPACSNCHRVDAAGTGGNPFALAPGLLDIHERAATRIEGESAEAYLERSIREPNTYIVAGFRGIMYADFAQDYTDQEIADLVAYLMTL